MQDVDTTVNAARQAFVSRFGWHDGHADVWAAFEDGPTLAAIVQGLAAPWAGTGVTRVVGVEARGFLLGGAVATSLGVGFHAVRKGGALFPGTKATTGAEPDYRGNQHQLSLRQTLTPDDVVLFVDDWAERGAQATATKRLVDRTGARWAGMSVLVDQLEDATRATLGHVTSVVAAHQLPACD